MTAGSRVIKLSKVVLESVKSLYSLEQDVPPHAAISSRTMAALDANIHIMISCCRGLPSQVQQVWCDSIYAPP